MPTNDNDSVIDGSGFPMPDSHGHAALLLVESLIHGLLERSLLSVDNAVEVVETAISVQTEVAEQADGHGAPMWRSEALLSAIAESLRREGGDGSPRLRAVPTTDLVPPAPKLDDPT